MSNIHNLEPNAFGLITFKTTFGTIDIELFTKQCPKATRNFVQLCLDGYYADTIFERVEKDFIAIGGVPVSPQSSKSHDETFPDEFHSRLKFTRRGLIATANSKKNENGPKFFFTLGPAPELLNKHTIFGRVIGNSVYTLTDLNECQVDEDCCPYSERRIIEAIVTENPYPDLVPRTKESKTKFEDEKEEEEFDSDDPLSRPKSDTSKSKKLSFYPDEDEEDDDLEENKDQNAQSLRKHVDYARKESTTDNMQTIDLKSEDNGQEENPAQCPVEQNENEGEFNENKEESLDEKAAREQKMREIRAQIQKIKEQIESGLDTRTRAKRKKEDSSNTGENSVVNTNESQGIKLSIAPKKDKYRERETIEMVANFKKKLKEATTKTFSRHHASDRYNDEMMNLDELDALDRVDGDDWLQHKFVANDE